VFSLIHAVLLRALPYPAPDRLVRVGHDAGQAVSIPELTFWKEHTAGFASAAGFRGSGDRSFLYGARPEWVSTMVVTAYFFRTLGVAPALGREFDGQETQQGGPLAVILTDGLWHRSCNDAPDILGRTVRLDDTSYVVIGVLPRRPAAPDRLLQPARTPGRPAEGDRGSPRDG